MREAARQKVLFPRASTSDKPEEEDKEGLLLSLPTFSSLQRALEDLGFTPEESYGLWRIVAAILKLGNLQFVPTTNMDGTEGCAISNDYGNPMQMCTLEPPFAAAESTGISMHERRGHSNAKILYPSPPSTQILRRSESHSLTQSTFAFKVCEIAALVLLAIK